MMKFVKRILRYLRKHGKMRLCFGGASIDSIHAWSDSDFAGDDASPKDSHKSTSSFYVFLGHSAIIWKSKLQATVAQSSTEAEFISASLCSNEVMWLRSVMRELGFAPSQSTLLFVDNKACKDSARNPVNYKRLKHINIRYHSLRERHENGDVYVLWIDGDYNLAGLGTKFLPRRRFELLRNTVFGLRRFELPDRKDPYERQRLAEILDRVYGSSR